MTMLATVDRTTGARDARSDGRPCPTCGCPAASTLHAQRYSLFDDSGLPGATRIVACSDCGTVYASSTATAADYRSHYTRHSKYDTATEASGSGETEVDAARLDGTVRLLATFVDAAGSIVDVGAGRGGLLLAFARHGCTQVTGIDPAPGCVAAMRARGLHAEVGTLELDTWPTDPATFDLVVLSHVLEHVYDVADAFARVTRRVAPGGAIYVEVPDAARYTTDGFPPFYFFDPEHINHFDEAALQRLAVRHGWTIEGAWQRTLPLGEGQRYPAIGALLRRAGSVTTGAPRPDGAAAVARYVAESRAVLRDGLDEEALGRLAAARTPVGVWGAGSYAQRLLAQSALGRCAIDCLVDADRGKQGRSLAGHAVVSPEAGLERIGATDATLVVAIAIGGHDVVERVRRALPAATILEP